jgi:Fe2+ transport system protein FeoA
MSRSTHTISDLKAGTQAIVDSLAGGHDFCSRLANLGFTNGAAIVVRQNYGHGPVVVTVRGTLVALGRSEAARVFVATGEA